jgi:selenophosphate synthetase-related protein
VNNNVRREKNLTYQSFKYRDLSIVKLGEQYLVISADSSGAIGMKTQDQVRVPNRLVASFCLRVALLETICYGAEPICVSDTVCNEMDPTGADFIEAIREELEVAGYSDILLTGSTEENFTTSMSAIGITVVGVMDKLKRREISKGDAIILLGEPLVGGEVLEHPNLVTSYSDVVMLVKAPRCLEAVPVGSKGIAYEAETLASLHGVEAVLFDNAGTDYSKSGGPATSVIAAVKSDFTADFPFKVIGNFI